MPKSCRLSHSSGLQKHSCFTMPLTLRNMYKYDMSWASIIACSIRLSFTVLAKAASTLPTISRDAMFMSLITSPRTRSLPSASKHVRPACSASCTLETDVFLVEVLGVLHVFISIDVSINRTAGFCHRFTYIHLQSVCVLTFV